MLVHDVELLDDQATLGRDDLHHLPGAADILARGDLDHVTAVNLEPACRVRLDGH